MTLRYKSFIFLLSANDQLAILESDASHIQVSFQALFCNQYLYKNGTGLNTTLRVKILKIYHTSFRLSLMYPPTKKNNDQYLTSLSLYNSLCWPHSKSWICLFKFRFCLLNIFMMLYNFQIFSWQSKLLNILL